MKIQKLKLLELEKLNDEQIAVALNRVLGDALASPNGSLDYLQKRIYNLEKKYKMSSEEMMNAVASGKCPETHAFATWAIDYYLLKDLSASQE